MTSSHQGSKTIVHPSASGPEVGPYRLDFQTLPRTEELFGKSQIQTPRSPGRETLRDDPLVTRTTVGF